MAIVGDIASLHKLLGHARRWLILCTTILVCSIVCAEVSHYRDGPVVLGVDIDGWEHMSKPQLDALIEDLHEHGVSVVRAGLSADNRAIEFAEKARAHGISILWQISLNDFQYGSSFRAYDKNKFPQLWPGTPLSAVDVNIFKSRVDAVLRRLDGIGVRLIAIEVGNEINYAAFNPDFDVPGRGKQLGSVDLHDDAEGRRISIGYLRYLKLLQAVNEVRGQYLANRRTPIITAGLGVTFQGDGKIVGGANVDRVSLHATIDFLRKNGLDALVDGYALHVYLPVVRPEDSVQRLDSRKLMVEKALTDCRAAGTGIGKPCWITEWGFQDQNNTCNAVRSGTDAAFSVARLKSDLQLQVSAEKVIALFYYVWNTDPWSRRPDPFRIFRCGKLTNAGMAALTWP